MLPIVINQVAWSVGLSAILETIDIPFALRTRVGPGKRPIKYSGPLRSNTVLCSFNTIQPSSFTGTYSVCVAQYASDLR